MILNPTSNVFRTKKAIIIAPIYTRTYFGKQGLHEIISAVDQTIEYLF